MLQLTLFLLGISACAFAWIMFHEPRNLWSGVSLLWTLFCSVITMIFLVSEYADWLTGHDILMNILISLLILAVGCAIAFPAVLIITLFIEGIKVIRHEGLKPANLLTMAFSVLLYVYLTVWPLIGGLEKGTIGTELYMIISISTIYVLSLLAVYLFSAALNLIHLKKQRGADYIILILRTLKNAGLLEIKLLLASENEFSSFQATC